MAKIRDRKDNQDSSSSYERIFNNKPLGMLISKVHATSISNGSELERLVFENIKSDSLVENCDNFFNNNLNDKFIGYRIFKKKDLKHSTYINFGKKFEPDFVVLKMDEHKRHCYIVELKDGYEFDTKKVVGEKTNLQEFKNYISSKIPFTVSIHMCCFNETDKEKIKKGLKNTFDLNEIMTGKEFCVLLGINHEKITAKRKEDAKDNLDYFLEELLKIPKAKEKLLLLSA